MTTKVQLHSASWGMCRWWCAFDCAKKVCTFSCW